MNRMLTITALMMLTTLILPLATVAQEPSATTLHPFLQPLVDQPTDEIPAHLRGDLGGFQGSRRIAGEEALDLHLRTTASRQQLDAIPGVRIRSMNDGRATATVLPLALPLLAQRSDVSAISLPRLFRPTLDKATNRSGIAPLRSQLGGVWSGNAGAGVVVGVIDTGIDFDHPNFTDPTGATRIAYLWDHTEDDPLRYPASWPYGTEWTAADIDAGLCTEEDEEDTYGHGTHVAGIAAGNGAAYSPLDGAPPDADGMQYVHVGMAPEATLIVVKANFTSTSIIDGLNYIFDRADLLGMPAVVNLSLGTNLGAHDGTSPVEQEIDTLVSAQDGRAVVVAAGDSRNDGVHAEIAAQPLAGTNGPDFEVATYAASPGAKNDGIAITGYYPSTDNLTVELMSPSGAWFSRPLNTLPFGGACGSAVATGDGTIQICNNFRSVLGEGTSDREIVILIWDTVAASPPAVGSWQISLTGNTVTGNGIVDLWMASSLGGQSGHAVFSTHVEEARTLATPATSQEAISVGAYVSKTCWQDYLGNAQSDGGAPTLEDIASFSSVGPTRDGRSKPDLAAPGRWVVSALAHEVRSHIIAQGDGHLVINDDYLILSGTSMAAPMVTGAVALLLAKDPTYSSSELEDILEDAARKDTLTAAHNETPGLLGSPPQNYTFGAGKLDLGPWAFNDPYETNDGLGGARDIASGELIEGYLETALDRDFFDLPDLLDGDTVDIDLTSLPADYRLHLTEIVATGACGELTRQLRRISDLAGTADESISYLLSASAQPQHIRVDSSLGLYDGTDAYELKAIITRPEIALPHNGIFSAQVLPFFEEFQVTGTVPAAGDRDYYSIEVGFAHTITASVPGNHLIEILDDGGTALSSGVGSAQHFNLGALGTRTTYYVVVEHPNPAIIGGGGYALDLAVQ